MKILFAAAALALAGLACLSSGPGSLPDTPETQPPVPTLEQPADTDWYSLYFTDPSGPGARSLRGGPDQALADAIGQARVSVDIAALDMNLWSIRDALLAAMDRGVTVRMVLDSDYLDTDEIIELQDADLPILGDRKEGLMHNKFVVIDRQEVWTGSMNFTITDAYKNNNNLQRIRSSRLATDYTNEFEEMFVDDQFGPGSPDNTPFPQVTVDDTRMEVYFSPDDGTALRLLELVDAAEESIYFLAFSFTSDDLADAMIERSRAGVDVAGIMETSQVSTNMGDEYDRLRAAGVDVRLDGNSNNMHHKVIIIDGQVVVTGSYNFSANAEERNDENTLIIFNPDIAGEYFSEFESIFELAAAN